MKIAVAYDNGNVFQHFGRTENYKVYDVVDGKVTASEVKSTNGIGHEAIAELLANDKIDVLICGGMGQGAKDALAVCGIEAVSGVEGDADEAVSKYLRGELESQGVNCDHHEHEHEEGHGCGGGGCAGCSGCGEPMYFFEGTNVGKTVKVHYRGTFNDGTQFDASYDRGEPLEFVCGTGMMIPGFDKAVAEMKVGDTIDIHLMPEEAYGTHNPQMVVTVEKADVQGSENLEIDDRVYLTDQLGRPFPARVTALEGTTITFDCNHEMVDKELNFSIEMMEIK